MPHSKTPGQSNAASDKYNKQEAEGTLPTEMFSRTFDSLKPFEMALTYIHSQGPRRIQRTRREGAAEAWRGPRSQRQRQFERRCRPQRKQTW
jgi:hypothetical protein